MARMLFEDIFEVLEKDPDGKKFDKVSRLRCRSDLYEMDLTLDVNSDLYPKEVGEKFSLALSKTLNLDGSEMEGHFTASLHSGKPSLLDKYDYVMHGKIFKFKDNTAGGHVRLEVFISFGGLLMQLIGDAKKLSQLENDMDVFLLMRSV
ncbi:hypothetical protein WJX72_002320 [[Myrmecia] bisecta]|uniref:DNA-directed RNA polymerases I, II, and III subunit RPABC3 n=1 Tax=[Myrmecia] bisecta TaxID=41462 RepID=A0AAW1QEG8_9CHLO